ncbi:hypothetical protein CLV31_101134 [Algoriphagus aquaeductus]|uniref:Uncharacterized protein n=1 Tax=Algoriphagus aquaeductus TaxID=475299 RepID=A0A326S6Z1_9BACT|nr:hypothetical protein [Algoriphagus aquaeductus]PZV87262.1 hypothetical protein CLV31_101134 [Algoriphagus aquaeductus]
MKIEDWKKLLSILDSQYSIFLLEYPTMKNGRNKKIRENSERKVYNSIQLSCNWITDYPEAYQLLTGKDNTDFGRHIIWDEFSRPNYFGSDMSEFLEKIKDKIKSLEEKSDIE